jgi:hypothetical protein
MDHPKKIDPGAFMRADSCLAGRWVDLSKPKALKSKNLRDAPEWYTFP